MDKELIVVDEENIYMDFTLNDQNYLVISGSEEMQEGDTYYIVKEDYIDGQRIIRNIEDDSEYSLVEAEFNRLLDKMDLEDDSNED